MNKFNATKVLAGLVCFAFIVSLTGCQPAASSEKTKPVNQTDSAGKEDPADLLKTGQGISEFSCTVNTILPGGKSDTSKLWFKSGNLRLEASNPENGEKIVTILNQTDKALYMCQPGQNTAMKMPAEGSNITSPKEQLQAIETGTMKFLRDELYDGKKCKVYQTGDGNTAEIVWLLQDKGLPARIETADDRGKGIIEYKDYKFDKIDDAVFKIPGGMQIIDMSSRQIPTS